MRLLIRLSSSSNSVRTLRVAISLLSLLMASCGIAVLVFGDIKDPLIGTLGSTLLATGTLTIGWEILVRRPDAQVQRQAIQDAVVSHWSDSGEGLLRVGRGVLGPDEVEEGFNNCTVLRAACLYDMRWVEREFGEKLRQYLHRPGVRVEFILPDPDDKALMGVLAARARHGPQDEAVAVVSNRVHALVEGLTHAAQVRPAAMRILYVRDFPPSYAVYLFESAHGGGFGVTRQYGHSMDLGQLFPETLFHQGGHLWRAASMDLEELRKRARGKEAFDANEPEPRGLEARTTVRSLLRVLRRTRTTEPR